MKSCLFCGLRTGCYLAAVYTAILAVILLVFNIHDYLQERDYYQWTRILSFVFAAALFVAAISLFIGVSKNSNSLIGVWMFIFILFLLFQLAILIWNITNYATGYDTIPHGIRTSVLANMVVFGLLVALNIFALAGVHSYTKSG